MLTFMLGVRIVSALLLCLCCPLRKVDSSFKQPKQVSKRGNFVPERGIEVYWGHNYTQS